MCSYKKWSLMVIFLSFLLILGGGIIVIIVDPYFHYHGPLNSLEYRIYNQRYQNDGIVKHFEYDAIITGTSMTENFKTTEFDELFHVNSVKVPFSGAEYKEIDMNLQRAVGANPNIKIVLRCLDGHGFLNDKDVARYSPDLYPSYLYDDIWYNDVNYILSKSSIERSFHTLYYTRNGGMTTSFDEYSNWMKDKIFGKEALKKYSRKKSTNTMAPMTEEDYNRLKENLEQNVTALVAATPDIDYFLFFPPYSIYTWDDFCQTGELERQLAAEKAVIELLLEYDNIHLFSFNDAFDLVCNEDNYKDYVHYGEWVNSQMLLWMKNGEHQLTKENYQNYCNRVYKFYTEYDYDKLYEE